MKKHFVKRVASVLLAGAVLVSSIPAGQTRAALFTIKKSMSLLHAIIEV